MGVTQSFLERVPGGSLKMKLLTILGVLLVVGAVTGGALYYAFPVQISIMGALTRNYLITFFAPSGTANLESNADYKAASAAAPSPPGDAPGSGDWPSYNRTLTSDRYSLLSQINTKNVDKLKVLCTYDTGQFTAFESGPLMVDNALIGTTEFDIF